MDPTLGEKQEGQFQEKQSRGGFGQGIKTINNLVGGKFRNPLGFGKIGSKAATQAVLRGFSALLTSQVALPILITIALIIIFTVIIVGFGGIPFSGPDSQTIINPTITPAPPVEL